MAEKFLNATMPPQVNQVEYFEVQDNCPLITLVFVLFYTSPALPVSNGNVPGLSQSRK
jgi:hypothetical protein